MTSLYRIKWAVAVLMLGLHAAIPASADIYTAEQIKTDFTQLYTELQQAHYDLYANISPELYDKHFTEFSSLIHSGMTEADVRLHFQRFMALGKIAHANIDLPMEQFIQFRRDGGKALPLYVQIDADVVTVDEVYGADLPIKTGQKILAINGRPINEWLADMAALLSADNERLAATLIEGRWPFLIWLLAGEQDTFSVRVKTVQGEAEYVVPALNRTMQQQFAATQTNSEELPERDARMLDGGIAYLKPGPFFNITPGAENVWDNCEFVRFIDTAFKSFIQQQAKALLIDLRQNPGGSNSFSDVMLAWFADKPFKFAADFIIKVSAQSEQANAERLAFSNDSNDISHQLAQFYQQYKNGERFSFNLPLNVPKVGLRFTAPVYLLIDRYSYSNAVSVAAIVQDYGFGRLIGEKTADLATTYGAMEHFKLTHTGIKVGYPKALIVRPSGQLNPDGVVPDLMINDRNMLSSATAGVEAARKIILADMASGTAH
ncbi:MAG: hypothetical protein LPK11_00790 [Chromatiaceae bacterium]|nr:hypothetical protein [Chromatiaceae bacterium]